MQGTDGKRLVKIGLIQVNAQYGPDVTVESCLEELLDLAERCLRDGADLVFMPETYQYKNARHIPRKELAAKYSEAYKERCAELARRYSAYVVPWDNEVDEAGNLYNTSYILDRSGVEIGRYRKVHLTRRELEKLAPGTEFPVFELDFGKVGIMICFDNYYAETARILALRGAELILYPLFGDTLNPGWEIKTRARAIDNSVFVAPCCLHAPERDVFFVYTGLIAPSGEVVSKIEQYGTHRVVEIDLDDSVMTNIRAVKGSCEKIKPYLHKTRNLSAYGPLLEPVQELEWDEIEFLEEVGGHRTAAGSTAGAAATGSAESAAGATAATAATAQQQQQQQQQKDQTHQTNQPHQHQQSSGVEFSVFTKPWPKLEVEQLAEKVKALGFHGIELPVRDGFQVEPRQVGKFLPACSQHLAEHGLKIYSIAGPTDEPTFAACAEAGVPVIRIMLDIDFRLGYWETERRILAELEGMQPLCERYGVKIGIQQHVGKTRVKTSAGLLRFLEPMDPRWFGAIWDAGHDGLRGEGPEIGLDMVWQHLCMVNLKNAHYVRVPAPEASVQEQAEWKLRFSTGREGMASWPAVANYLTARNYNGVVCLTAEYDDDILVDQAIEEDIAYAKGLFAEAQGK